MAIDNLPPPAAIDEELARLAAGDALRRAPGHLKLLRYLVERRLAGDLTGLREPSIALEVFRRDPATYDPQTDPIVRVTIGRLRERLDSHYAAIAARPKLRIVLPKGRYGPEFIVDPGGLPRPRGLAVLRMRNRTGDSELATFGDALVDRLTDNLTRAGVARVIARGSVHAAEECLHEPTAIGAQLQVTWLIETVLSRDTATELRLTARLVDASDGSVRWAEYVARPDADRYTLADRLVDRVVSRTCETLTQSLVAGDDAKREALPTQMRVAIDTGHLLLLQRMLAATDEAVALGEATAAACPTAAPAWAMLAAALYSRLSFSDRTIAPLAERVKDAADRALALDPDDAVALRTKAIMVAKYDRDVVGAEALFAKALRALPHYTSARLNYSETLALQGRFDEAVAQTGFALIYDPLSASVRMARALTLRFLCRYDEARSEWALCRASGDASIWTLIGSGLNELAAGDLDRAGSLLDEARARFPDLPGAYTARALLHAAKGEPAAARALEHECAARFGDYSRTDRAMIASLLGDKPAVLEHLAAAIAEHDMQFLYAGIDPAFAWLAQDADFLRVLAAGGIPRWRGLPSHGTDASANRDD